MTRQLDHTLLTQTLEQQRTTIHTPRAALANRLGTCNAVVGRWFRNTADLPLSMADKLLDALELGRLRLRSPNLASPNVVECLYKARVELHLSSGELAAWVGVTAPTLLAWERNEGRGPTMDYLERWAVALGLGGIVASLPPRYGVSVPLAYLPAPSAQAVSQMMADDQYDARRYIPFSLAYARQRVAARRLGIEDRHFTAPLDQTYRGVPVIDARFRPLWTQFSVRCGDVREGLQAMLTSLEDRRLLHAN